MASAMPLSRVRWLERLPEHPTKCKNACYSAASHAYSHQTYLNKQSWIGMASSFSCITGNLCCCSKRCEAWVHLQSKACEVQHGEVWHCSLAPGVVVPALIRLKRLKEIFSNTGLQSCSSRFLSIQVARSGGTEGIHSDKSIFVQLLIW